MAAATQHETLALMAQLHKAEDPARVLDLLGALGRVAMTFDVLVDTKVGNVVKPLKKGGDAAVADAAGALIAKWRIVADQHNSAVPTPRRTLKQRAGAVCMSAYRSFFLSNMQCTYPPYHLRNSTCSDHNGDWCS